MRKLSSVARIAVAIEFVLVATIATTLIAQRAGTAPEASAVAQAAATARIVAAAQAVVSTLDAAGRAKVQFAWDNDRQRRNWSNFPQGMVQREGLRMGDLTPVQRTAVMSLLQVALSKEGYQKVNDIMDGDETLKSNQGGRGRAGFGSPAIPNVLMAQGGGGRGGRGPAGPGGGGANFGRDLYFLSFLGAPSTTTAWMLQFGGHHLAINLTMVGSQATMAPSLPAAQPATFTIEGRTVRPLGDENDKAFALVNALDADQRKQAILTYRVADLVLGPTEDGKTIQAEGIKASALTAQQQTMMWDLAREWVGIMNDAFAEPRMAELRSHGAETYFAWSGPTANGSAAYFRIQGPTLVIEYAPQGGVDHIHTIYRDPTNDYGAKIAPR
jgi:hypothetical protein